MNKKILLGLTLAAVLAMAVASPAVAEAITEIKKTEVKVKDGEIDKLKFHLTDKLPESVFGGYAMFTSHGEIVAITSHAGFYDSVAQEPPTDAEVLVQVGAIAAACTEDAVDACGAEWHSHLVEAALSPYCSNVAVTELTFNEPAEKVKAKKKHVEAKHIDLGAEKFVGAISGEYRDFTVFDAPLEPTVLAFDLNAAYDAGVLSAICIGETTGYEAPVATETELLCADIGGPTFAEAQAYKLLVGAGGPNNKIDIVEFQYSDALWTEINGVDDLDVIPEGLGGEELKAWYAVNCVP